MVTARVEEIDRLLGLELGADDYICKPFSPREVVARVKAVLRRARCSRRRRSRRRSNSTKQRFEARVRGRALTLTPVEFRLLRKLAAQPGRVFSRQQLIDALYGDHRVVSDRTVDSHVKNLRRKLAELGVDPIARCTASAIASSGRTIPSRETAIHEPFNADLADTGAKNADCADKAA